MNGTVQVQIEVDVLDEQDAQEIRRAWKIVLENLQHAKATISVKARVK